MLRAKGAKTGYSGHRMLKIKGAKTGRSGHRMLKGAKTGYSRSSNARRSKNKNWL